MKKHQIHFETTQHQDVYTVHFSSASSTSSSTYLEFLKKLPSLRDLMRKVYPSQEKKALLPRAEDASMEDPVEKEYCLKKNPPSKEVPEENPQKDSPSKKKPDRRDKLPPERKSFFGTSLFTFLLILALATTSVFCFQPIFQRLHSWDTDFDTYVSEGSALNFRIIQQLKNIDAKLTQDGLLPEPPSEEKISQNQSHLPQPEILPPDDEKEITGEATKEATPKIVMAPASEIPYTLPAYEGVSQLQKAQVSRGKTAEVKDLYFFVTDQSGKPVDQYMLESSYPNPKGSKFSLTFLTDAQGKVSYLESSSSKYQEWPGFFQNQLDLSHSELRLLPHARYLFVIPGDYPAISGSIHRDIVYGSWELALKVVLSIAAAFILLTFLLALFIPWGFQKTASVLYVFNHSWLEIKILFFALGIAFLGATLFTNPNFGNTLFQHSLVFDLNPSNGMTSVTAMPLFYAIGIPTAFVGLFLVYLLGVYLKYIVYNGVVDGLIKNSLTGQILFWTGNAAQKSIQRFGQGLHRRTRLKLILLLGISSFFLFIGLSTWPMNLFHVFLLLAYSIVPYMVVTRYLRNMRALESYSQRMASGDFDFVMEQNLGTFQTVGDNMNQIRSGFKKAVEEEMKSQSMKTQLITNVSHDLKTPLTSIISYADLLKQGGLDETTQKEYIDVIYRKSQRLNVLIQDLFDASKASSGNIDLHLEKLNILSLFHQAIGEMEDKFAEKNLQVKLRILGSKKESPSQKDSLSHSISQQNHELNSSSWEDLPPLQSSNTAFSEEERSETKQSPSQKLYCMLDGRQTSRIFENILSNIIKYALLSSRVYVDVESKNGYVAFTFKNISNYEMNFDVEEISQRFTRGDSARSTEGSGLGLSIAKSLTELQKGLLEIHIDGDLFKLTLAYPTCQ